MIDTITDSAAPVLKIDNQYFANKRILIYGGANGIGRAAALEFHTRGAALALADIDLASATATAAEINAVGGKAIAIHCDVTNDDSVQAAADDAEAGFGDIDIVMNNVGVIMAGNAEDIPLAEWQRVMNLNLLSTVRSNAIFLPKMIERGAGHIVNTASFAGLYPYAVNRMPYAASKAALVAMSESLAVYLIPQGINVSYFCPGPVMTNVSKGIKNWSENSVMCGPGSQFDLMSAEQAAAVLADGMAGGRIFIPTHEHVTEMMQQRAASPDQFIRDKIAQIALGNFGLPKR